MKLYYSPAACSLSPHIVIKETGLDIELVKVDLRNHTFNHGEDFFTLSPAGAVPALSLPDGTVLTEGPAVIQYLADLKPESLLAPPNGTLLRYQLQQWLNFLSTEIHKGFIPVIYGDPEEHYIKRAKMKLMDRFRLINHRLGEQNFLLSDAYSVADCYLFALIGWAQAGWLTSYMDLDIHLDDLHHLAAWYRRVAARDAVKLAIKEEGLTATA